MPDELNLINLMKSWLKDKFPEIIISNDEHSPEEMIRLSIAAREDDRNPYTGLIGFVHGDVGLWDNGEMKLAGGRYIYYDPRDPKFFEQVYEHLVRIVELSKKR